MHEPDRSDRIESDAAQPSLTFAEVCLSVCAAMLGVQSRKHRFRDFTRGRFSHFAIVGVLFTLGFVVALIALVRVILSLAGA